MNSYKRELINEIIGIARKLERIPTRVDLRENMSAPDSVYTHWGTLGDMYREVFNMKVRHRSDRVLLYKQWIGSEPGLALNDETKIEFIDKRKSNFNWREWVKAAKKMQEFHSESSSKQDVASINIDSGDSPIVVVFSADWHLGSVSADYLMFLKNIDFILNTPNVFIGVVGDTIDNFHQFKNVHAILQQVFPPSRQRKLLGEIFSEMVNKKKLLFVGYGNHEARDEKWIGDNLVARLVEDDIPYFSGKGIVKLNVGDQLYTILAMHKTGRNSKINALYGAKQEYLNYFPADIVVTGHHHIPAIESYMHFGAAQRAGIPVGGMTWLIKTGTYNVDDGFSKRYYDAGMVCDPSVVLFPREKKIVPFMSASDAVMFINSFKSKR